MKKSLPVLLLSAAFLAAQPAVAAFDWNDDDEGVTKGQRIFNRVQSIQKEVVSDGGNLKEVAEELRKNLQDKRGDKGMLIRESIGQSLEWLGERRLPYLDFMKVEGPEGLPNFGCFEIDGSSSACGRFRNELIKLFKGFAALKTEFPAIQKFGVGDGERAERIINITPALILFGLHEALDKVDRWQQLPEDLREIFDEIGDIDAFSIRLRENETKSAAAFKSLSALNIREKSPTQRFCDRWESRVDRELDPVRINRIRAYLFYMKLYIGMIEAATSETLGVSVVGEGSDTVVPNPLKIILKAFVTASEMIDRAIDDVQKNIGVCRGQRRELEMNVAQCIRLVDFVMPSMRNQVYQFVKTKVGNARDEGVKVETAQMLLRSAEDLRNRNKWNSAYIKLCDAYRAIGE